MEMEQDFLNLKMENGVGGAGAGGRRRRTQGHEDMLSLAAKRKKEEAADLEKQANKLRTINEKYNRLQKAEEEKRKVRCTKIREKCRLEKAKAKAEKAFRFGSCRCSILRCYGQIGGEEGRRYKETPGRIIKM